MTKIKLYNTKTRTKEDFVPIDPANVRMYVCGPTVYDRAHIGNARPVVVFDTLFRLLRHVYGHYAVRYVRNFTDVDDKINARAAEMKAKGDARDLKAIIRELTDQTIAWYHEDMEALGTLRPTDEPRATEYIAQMVSMIEVLIEKGHAYASEGHVLFDVNSYDPYGALSGRKLDDMRAGERVEVAAYKRDPMDFVLWKPSTDDLPGWDSPWGRGRPGWHIECSAMSLDLLGATFDIHGGGLDLQFPHHENEIAQSCCANPDGGFANVWMHNEMIQVEGKKMSKSLGNFFTVKDLLDHHYDGAVIKLVLMSTHYRKPIDWTEARYLSLKGELTQWELLTYNVDSGDVPIELLEALKDDLNTPQALAVLRKMKKEKRFSELLAGMEFLGIPALKAVSLFTIDEELKLRIEELLEKYDAARNSKDYSLSDSLRKLLEDLGVSLSTGPDGTTHEIIWSNVGAERLLDTNSPDFNRLTGLDREESKKWLLEKLEALK